MAEVVMFDMEFSIFGRQIQNPCGLAGFFFADNPNEVRFQPQPIHHRSEEELV